MDTSVIERGWIYMVQLGPTRGREVNTKPWRPAVVVSINDLNRKDLVVNVVPGTSLKHTRPRVFENEALIQPSADNGLTLPTLFMGNQIRALDKSRFKRSAQNLFELLGALDASEMEKIDHAVRYCLGLLNS